MVSPTYLLARSCKANIFLGFADRIETSRRILEISSCHNLKHLEKHESVCVRWRESKLGTGEDLSDLYWGSS